MGEVSLLYSHRIGRVELAFFGARWCGGSTEYGLYHGEKGMTQLWLLVGGGRILELNVIYWGSAQCRRVFSFAFETFQKEVDL